MIDPQNYTQSQVQHAMNGLHPAAALMLSFFYLLFILCGVADVYLSYESLPQDTLKDSS